MTKLNKNYCPIKKQQIIDVPRVREDFIWWTALSRAGSVLSFAGSARDISQSRQQQQQQQLPFDINYIYYGLVFVFIFIIIIIMF